MKVSLKTLLLIVFSGISLHLFAQTSMIGGEASETGAKHLYMDIHNLGAGKVKLAAVAQAHARDLAVQNKYGVQFLKYWVDEKQGLIFCLVSANDSELIRMAHAEAHGLLPQRIYPVTGKVATNLKGNQNLFIDVHVLGHGVSPDDVAGAHLKDLAIQGKYGVNISNYWLDQKDGVIICLAEAKDAASLINTHKEAHGLVPAKVYKVTQGE